MGQAAAAAPWAGRAQARLAAGRAARKGPRAQPTYHSLRRSPPGGPRAVSAAERSGLAAHDDFLSKSPDYDPAVWGQRTTAVLPKDGTLEPTYADAARSRTSASTRCSSETNDGWRDAAPKSASITRPQCACGWPQPRAARQLHTRAGRTLQ